MRIKNYRFLGAVLVSALSTCALLDLFAAVTEEDLYRIFEEYSIEFNPETVEAGKLEGMLAAVDGRARIVSTNDAAWPPDEGEAIEAAERWSEAIVYLDVGVLGEGSGPAIVRQLTAWNADQPAGIILDLRATRGNDLASVREVAALFAPRDTTLYQVRNPAGMVVEKCRTPTNGRTRVTCPLMVLVDRETAGAGEVLAAVLKGRNHVMLVGEQTRGHEGLMQLVPLNDADYLYIATRWVMLEEREIPLDQGVVPDIAVHDEEEGDTDLPAPGKTRVGKALSAKAQRDRDLMERVSGDAVLARATDVLLALNAIGPYMESARSSTNLVPGTGPETMDSPPDD